jgi:hypothetical protein
MVWGFGIRKRFFAPDTVRGVSQVIKSPRYITIFQNNKRARNAQLQNLPVGPTSAYVRATAARALAMSWLSLS